MSKQRPRGGDDGPAAELARFVAGLSVEDVPEAGLRLAERCSVDTIGVALAGAVPSNASWRITTVVSLPSRTAANASG